MGKVWFTSDTHFGAERTLELSKRPYATTSLMDLDMIRKWNLKVSKEDTVYHLGDFGNYDMVSRLNGKVNLILGNYEEKDMEQFDSFESFRKYLLDKGFGDVIEKEAYYLGNIGLIHMTHKPSESKKEVFNLFGHVHKLSMIKLFGLNVGVDCHNFYPIDANTVEAYKIGIEKYYDKEVFIQKLD